MTHPQPGWHIAHIAFLSAWATLVIIETILETLGRLNPSLEKTVAQLHYLFDLCIELPLLVGVFITGAQLIRFSFIDSILLIKIAFGIMAILINLLCVILVIKRWKLIKKGETEIKLQLFSRWIRRAGVGVPFALVALWIGAKRGGWF